VDANLLETPPASADRASPNVLGHRQLADVVQHRAVLIAWTWGSGSPIARATPLA